MQCVPNSHYRRLNLGIGRGFAVIVVALGSSNIIYQPYDGFLQNGQTVSADSFPNHRVPSDDNFEPIAMELHEKSDIRESIPDRICLLGNKQNTIRSFSVPSGEK